MTTQPNPIAIELKAMADRLRELFPESPYITLTAANYGAESLGQEVALHSIGDYQAGTALLRRIGLGKWNKNVFGEAQIPWSTIKGEANGVTFEAYCSNLPPSCHIETVTKRIPKTATVDTGEFIEVQERVVKCGGTPKIDVAWPSVPSGALEAEI